MYPVYSDAAYMGMLVVATRLRSDYAVYMSVYMSVYIHTSTICTIVYSTHSNYVWWLAQGEGCRCSGGRAGGGSIRQDDDAQEAVCGDGTEGAGAGHSGGEGVR